MDLDFLFWNVGGKQVDLEILQVVQSTGAKFVALAEYSGVPRDLLNGLLEVDVEFNIIPVIGCDRIKIFSTIKSHLIRHNREGDRFTFKEIVIPGFKPLLVGLVHLPSKQYATEVDQLLGATYFKREIEQAEASVDHENTVIFGDFNMNPYDGGMVSASALNSVSCLKVAERGARSISGNRHDFFYNPSWNLLGDIDDNPGTYFFSTPGYLSQYWHTLDQVIIRPTLGENFDKSSLKIVKAAGSISLENSKGRPMISDHFPISFKIKLT